MNQWHTVCNGELKAMVNSKLRYKVSYGDLAIIGYY